MQKCNRTVIVDKTGTLTEGKPKLVALESIGEMKQNDFLQIAASLEHASEHHIGLAIVEALENQNTALLPVKDFDSITGQGISGVVNGQSIVIGNSPLLASLNVDTKDLQKRAEALREDGATVVLVAIESKAAGLIAVSDDRCHGHEFLFCLRDYKCFEVEKRNSLTQEKELHTYCTHST
jgi:Cu+-exporting ATPase